MSEKCSVSASEDTGTVKRPAALDRVRWFECLTLTFTPGSGSPLTTLVTTPLTESWGSCALPICADNSPKSATIEKGEVRSVHTCGATSTAATETSRIRRRRFGTDASAYLVRLSN